MIKSLAEKNRESQKKKLLIIYGFKGIIILGKYFIQNFYGGKTNA